MAFSIHINMYNIYYYNKMAKISIIIRCYNEEKYIGRLLVGIMQQLKEDDIEIILVDSGSTDATLSIASQYPIKVVYIPPEEFSFGRALNLGCSKAKGDYFVFISAHCWPVYNDWLKQLIKPFDDKNVGLVYGKQRGNEESFYSELQLFKSYFSNLSLMNQTHPFCNNANCVIPRSLWEKQQYDEELTGLEDLDWAKKILSKGYTIAYSAEAEIVHVHQASNQNIFNRYKREAIALKNIYPDEKFTLLNFLSLSLRNIYNDAYVARKEGVLHNNLKDIFRFRIMQFWGTYKGNSQKIKIDIDLKRTFYYPCSDKKNLIIENNEKKIDYQSVYSEDKKHDY